MITHQANNWVLWLQLSGWATRVNEEYSRSWNNKQEFRIHQLSTQKQIFRVADRAVPQPPSCKEAAWLAGRISKQYLQHSSTLITPVISRQWCYAHYNPLTNIWRFSSKPRLYSRRRIFLLFGNPSFRHRVHGTPPLDSSSNRSYLNPIHTCSHPIYCIHILVLPCQPRRRSNHQFLGAFAKLPTAAVSSCLSVRVSVRMEKLGSHWVDFHEIWYAYFRKSVEKIQVSLKSYKNNGYFLEDQYNISGLFLLRMRNVLDKSCRGRQNTHFVLSNFFFFK
jgi:hypothetical protein